MSGLEFFDQELRLMTEHLAQDVISAELAKFAREEVRKVIAAGTAPEQYERFVNGQPGLAEEAVEAPGPIVYMFNNWPALIESVLAELVRRAPRRSGRFASSFIVIVGGAVVTDFRVIPMEAEVIITNFQPYIRQVEAGNLGIARRRQFDGTKSQMARRYSVGFSFETQFLDIRQGVHPEIPYLLKRGERLRTASRDMRSSVFRAGGTVLARRRDRAPGQPITYPAIVINAIR